MEARVEARVEALERELRELKMGKPTPEKKKRKPSDYNIFMQTEMAKIKISHPNLSHKDRFKLAASRYGAKKSSE